MAEILGFDNKSFWKKINSLKRVLISLRYKDICLNIYKISIYNEQFTFNVRLRISASFLIVHNAC